MALADAVPFAVANWPLSEASGNAIDAVASHDGTETGGTIAAAGGLLGSAGSRDFESADTEYFAVASHADLQLGDNRWMIRLLVQLESKGATWDFVSKYSFGADKEYRVGYDAGADRFFIAIRDTVGGDASRSASDFGSPSTGTPYLIHAWHDSTANELGIAVNAGTATTMSHTTGVNTSTAALWIGAEEGGDANFFDGLLADIVLLKGYILDATERTEDYNGGSVVPFADWDGGGGPAPVRRRRLLLGVG